MFHDEDNLVALEKVGVWGHLSTFSKGGWRGGGGRVSRYHHTSAIKCRPQI